MDRYVTGAAIKRLREEKKLTQAELADMLCVSDKAVSKWETGRGYPDITLLEPLSAALGVSPTELLAGESISNRNRAGNMLRSKFYVCPVCGNTVHSMGGASVSCCGIQLPPLEAEETDADHELSFERVEDEYYVTIDHPMTKDHYISFIAAVSDESVQLTKLYPEGACHARVKAGRTRWVYAYCNRHGLVRVKAPK